MASRRAALSFNASLIATFSIYLFINFIYLFIYLFINNSPHMKIPSGVTDNVHLTTESSWSAHSGLTSRDVNQASTAKASETRPRPMTSEDRGRPMSGHTGNRVYHGTHSQWRSWLNVAMCWECVAQSIIHSEFVSQPGSSSLQRLMMMRGKIEQARSDVRLSMATTPSSWRRQA